MRLPRISTPGGGSLYTTSSFDIVCRIGLSTHAPLVFLKKLDPRPVHNLKKKSFFNKYISLCRSSRGCNKDDNFCLMNEMWHNRIMSIYISNKTFIFFQNKHKTYIQGREYIKIITKMVFLITCGFYKFTLI